MDRRRFVKKPDVASLLANDYIAKPFQGANQPLGRYSSREFQAASTAISSSFTK